MKEGCCSFKLKDKLLVNVNIAGFYFINVLLTRLGLDEDCKLLDTDLERLALKNLDVNTNGDSVTAKVFTLH